MTIEEAICYLEQCADGLDPDFDNAASLAVAALRAQQERENSEPKGLFGKYIVRKASDGTPIDNCFVLRPEKDPAAITAIRAYAEATDNSTIATDLLQWVGEEKPLTLDELREMDFKSPPSMKRMTYWCDDGKGGGEWRANVRGTEVLGAEIDRLATYEDTGLEPEEVRSLCEMDSRARMADLLRLEEYQALGSIDHLRELVQAERDGRLVVLPCKVGSIVYALWSVPTPDKYVIYCAEVKEIRISKRNCRVTTTYLLEPIEFRGRRKEYRDDAFGKTVFLTREEAEAALGGGTNEQTP